ncbi:Uncharacterized protein HZ326_25288 [Fusarium oxysporum f. sp. albedinis]|nr:hypothetical protein HZ326_31353 [Fusarium oxysporum f. sp. albedinis]KAJ0131629.1 Uncharacterized protein HZ326_25288 [Fusarium oxysporum f. sp. albedinis]
MQPSQPVPPTTWITVYHLTSEKDSGHSTQYELARCTTAIYVNHICCYYCGGVVSLAAIDGIWQPLTFVVYSSTVRMSVPVINNSLAYPERMIHEAC